MLKHDFGIMTRTPLESQIYDEYNLEEYDDVISVAEKDIMKAMNELNEIHMYWHTLKNPKKGLAYCGVTLISPKVMKEMLIITTKYLELQELTSIIEKAMEKNRYIIHFGI